MDTWLAIHDAAAELVLKDGWSSATVDRIAATAGVSSRTFFNYFANKEDAVLGAQTPKMSDAALAVFHTRDRDLLNRAVDLMATLLRSSYPDDSLRDRRVRIVRQIPELSSRLKHLAAAVEGLVEPLLVDEISAVAAEHGIPSNRDPHDVAKMLTLASATIIRYSLSRQPDALAKHHTESIHAAVDMFREVTESSSWLNQ